MQLKNVPGRARTPQRAQSQRANERQAGSLLTKIYRMKLSKACKGLFDERKNIHKNNQKQARGLTGLQNKI